MRKTNPNIPPNQYKQMAQFKQNKQYNRLRNAKGPARDVPINAFTMTRFLLPSLLGLILLFSWPGIARLFLNLYQPMAVLICLLMSLYPVLSFVHLKWKPAFLQENKLLSQVLCTRMLRIVSLFMGSLISWYLFLFKGEAIQGVSKIYFDAAIVLFVWFLVSSFIMPFFSDYGVLECLGAFFKKFMPKFGLPRDSSKLAFEALLTDKNICESENHTPKEVAVLATCFSAVSIPICMAYASALTLPTIPLYLSVLVCVFVLAFLLPKIWPLSLLSTAFSGKRYEEPVTENAKISKDALQAAVNRTAKIDIKKQLLGSLGLFLSHLDVLFFSMSFAATILGIGAYTPVFDYISLPFGYLLQFLGLPEAMEAAKVVWVSFFDMLSPAVLLTAIASSKTRFVLGGLVLAQMIHLSSSAISDLRSKNSMKFYQLIILFLVRTIIALLIFVALAAVFGAVGMF